jgi:hypothetical protein
LAFFLQSSRIFYFYSNELVQIIIASAFYKDGKSIPKVASDKVIIQLFLRHIEILVRRSRDNEDKMLIIIYKLTPNPIAVTPPERGFNTIGYPISFSPVIPIFPSSTYGSRMSSS